MESKRNFKSKGRRVSPKKAHSEDEVGGSFKKPYIGKNDYSWRSKKDLLTQSAASLPFGNPIGVAQNVNPSYTIGLSYTVPGVLAIQTMITAGDANDYNSPVNLAGRQLYSEMRKSNSGSKNYDVPDLTLYVISYGQALAMLGFYQRLYHTVLAYSPSNRYTPKTLVEAQHVSWRDLKDHQAEFAFLISWMANALNALPIPNLTYFKACYESFTHYYCDTEGIKEQIYMLTPYKFGRYNPTATSAGGGVTFDVDFSTGTFAFQYLVTSAHAVMDVLLSDSDIALMCGDLAKAFPDLYKPEALTTQDVTTPIYSVELLQQIHNVSVAPIAIAQYEQNPGTTNTGPYLQIAYAGTMPSDNLYQFQGLRIDAFSDKPSPEEVVNCTVLQVTSDSPLATRKLFFDLYYPIQFEITQGLDANAVMLHFDQVEGAGQIIADMGNTTWGIHEYNIITQFDWHPFISLCDTDAQGHITDMSFIGDMKNIRWFACEVANNIHTCSMLSLFDFTDNKF